MLKKDGTYSSTHYIIQTYFPGQSDQFKLTPIEKDPQFRKIKTLIELDEQEDKKIGAEFYDAWKKNIKYKQLTLDSGVELLSVGYLERKVFEKEMNFHFQNTLY